ncbi:MAG: class I SAM-dependent methyltransferase [Thermomicrobiales bacterium]
MNHDDHVRLIENGIGRGSGGVWADFGAGGGAFTLALRDVAGPEVEIIAVDRDRGSRRTLRQAMDRCFPGTTLRLREADFTQELRLPPLDGILTANAIHYVPWQEQAALWRRWRDCLKPAGRVLVVGYDADEGNRWVPYPVSFAALAALAREAGFAAPVLLGTVPSRFLGRMYAAKMTAPNANRADTG